MPSAATSADVASVVSIRPHFPALERREGGAPVAFFDGPGGTQVPRAVADAMTDYLLRHNANTHWVYPTSVETDAMITASRAALADFLGGDPSEIVFGANMTTLTFHLSRALARGWQPGDEVVVTELDHHANVDPWRALERDFGVVVKAAPLVPGEARLDLGALGRLLTKKTRLVAVGAASNAVGTINDVARVAALARANGSLAFVDAVHYAPHALVDVKALGADFLACSPYKFYGPHAGVLWGKRALLEALDAPKLRPAPENAPDRLETGTQNHEGIAGCGAAVDFLASLAGGGGDRRSRLARTFAALHARGEELLSRMWNGLSQVPGVTLYGPPPGAPRTPTVGFTVEGWDSAAVARALVPHGVYVSNGDFYATTLVEKLGHGADGLVRAGAACYTTPDEVDRLVSAVARLSPRGH
ncbi:MAG TPA: cysteine desulfurase-like protein [Thermoanaerobaculia bacterium]|nr:cysteine desulfurase-like protein [Thermoanaerobaculia bacterium]